MIILGGYLLVNNIQGLNGKHRIGNVLYSLQIIILHSTQVPQPYNINLISFVKDVVRYCSKCKSFKKNCIHR